MNGNSSCLRLAGYFNPLVPVGGHGTYNFVATGVSRIDIEAVEAIHAVLRFLLTIGTGY